LVVEVPISPLRFSGRGHKDSKFSPQAAVVRLHQEVFFALGPSGKLFSRNKKLRTSVGLD